MEKKYWIAFAFIVIGFFCIGIYFYFNSPVINNNKTDTNQVPGVDIPTKPNVPTEPAPVEPEPVEPEPTEPEPTEPEPTEPEPVEPEPTEPPVNDTPGIGTIQDNVSEMYSIFYAEYINLKDLEKTFSNKISSMADYSSEQKTKLNELYTPFADEYNKILSILNDPNITEAQKKLDNTINDLEQASEPNNKIIDYKNIKTMTISLIQQDNFIKNYLVEVLNSLNKLKENIPPLISQTQAVSNSISRESIINDLENSDVYKNFKNILEKINLNIQYLDNVKGLETEKSNITQMIEYISSSVSSIFDKIYASINSLDGDEYKLILEDLYTIINNITSLETQINDTITQNTSRIENIEKQISNLNTLMVPEGIFDIADLLQKYVIESNSFIDSLNS